MEFNDFQSLCERPRVRRGDGVNRERGGFSFQNSGHQKVVDFTDGDYFFSFNLSLPHEICIICFHLCLLLGFHKRHTQNVSCPSQPIGAGGLDSICGHLALWLPTQIELEGRIFNTACNSSRSDLQTEKRMSKSNNGLYYNQHLKNTQQKVEDECTIVLVFIGVLIMYR